jgi:hypothetical protein
MALPAHFSQYDGLVDLVVERIVREIEQDAETKTPVGTLPPTGANSQLRSTPTRRSIRCREQYPKTQP